MKKRINIIKKIHDSKALMFLPMIIVAWMAANFFTRERVIFPRSDLSSIFCQSDSHSDTGHSMISKFEVSDSQIAISYTLKKGIPYPYAGFSINLCNNDSIFYDISKFDYFVAEIIPVSAENLTVYFTTNINGFSNDTAPLSRCYHLKEFSLSKEKLLYRYKIKEFITPAWWYSENNKSENDLPPEKFEHVANVVFENGSYEELDKKYTFIVKRISFVKDDFYFNILSLIGIALFYLIYFLVYHGLIRKADTIIIPYKQLEVQNYADEDINRIAEYIAKNYDHSDLTVSVISREIGIAQQKINLIVKKKFDISFRQYLNSIKINEAKRLLRETDRQITDIAYRVGYKNVSHFNRIFKNAESLSPKEYRKANVGNDYGKQ